MQISSEQRAALTACADSLKELAGFARKIEMGQANPTEQRRAAELVKQARAELTTCAEIIRAAA